MLEMMIHFENLKHPHKLPDHLVKERLASGVRCSASGSTFYIFWRFCQPPIWRSLQEITQPSQLKHLQEKAKTYKRLASVPPGVCPGSEGVPYRDHLGLARSFADKDIFMCAFLTLVCDCILNQAKNQRT
ncbi:hypothetical protein [Zymobacter sp. IVIA_5232.4 C2]|uniref:hypothetical protein n=1 Tax=Zymobacter sp. IVIA_5232.4 C2 TaxID=3394855 RepID=UPI0039C3E0F4